MTSAITDAVLSYKHQSKEYSVILHLLQHYVFSKEKYITLGLPLSIVALYGKIQAIVRAFLFKI